MKLFLKIYFSKVIPSREFWKGFFTMLAIMIGFFVPLFFLIYALPNTWYKPIEGAAIFGLEYYLFIIGLISMREYEKIKNKGK